jgi:hypothetical protein
LRGNERRPKKKDELGKVRKDGEVDVEDAEEYSKDGGRVSSSSQVKKARKENAQSHSNDRSRRTTTTLTEREDCGTLWSVRSRRSERDDEEEGRKRTESPDGVNQTRKHRRVQTSFGTLLRDVTGVELVLIHRDGESGNRGDDDGVEGEAVREGKGERLSL